MLRTLLAALLVSTAAAANSELVGPESCRSCHREAYDAWKASPHARAHLSLTAEQSRQPLCLQCHSRDEAKSGQARAVGVSCETCHGAGRSYQPEAVMRDKELARMVGLLDVTPSSCLACHNGDSPSLQPFDPKEAMARIDHWTAERNKHAPKKAAHEKDAPQPKRADARETHAAAPKTRLATWLRGEGKP